jgi:4-hydroxy-tetrahydrodipicolinate synthase
VLTGDDASILPGIALGACGVVSVLSNLIPREMTRFTRHCLEGRFAEAREQLPALLELIGVCGLETNPIPIKTALALVGRINERVRAPLGRMSEPNRGRLARTLEALLPRVEGITPGPRSREPLFERRAQAVGAQIGLVETAADE